VSCLNKLDLHERLFLRLSESFYFLIRANYFAIIEIWLIKSHEGAPKIFCLKMTHGALILDNGKQFLKSNNGINDVIFYNKKRS